MKSKKLAITMGDPAGIGAEVCIKGIAMLPASLRRRVIIIGNMALLKAAQKLSKTDLKLITKNPSNNREVQVIETGTTAKIAVGKVSAKAGKAATSYIKKAVQLSINGEVAGLVTAPINKQSLSKAGFGWAGHTEMLAELSSTKDYAMMLTSKAMSVVLLNTHLAIKDVPRHVKKAAVLKKILLMQRALQPKKPIAVCGLNPHASDGGIFGNEEQREIIPAIEAAKKQGVMVQGPFAADTLFSPQLRKNYSAILVMYHDQGLVAIKATSFGNCANVTLGLPFIRTSVDHGTGFDIAGKGLADGSSMAYAIKTGFKMMVS